MSGGTLVVGGGLAGLSAAWHLGRGATLLEAAPVVGGLCRSYRRDGYTFDVSGHLLHFRQPPVRRFVCSLVPGALARHRRRALVRFGRRWVHYPFQAHLFELPARVRDECLRGFFKAAGEKATGAVAPADFEGWLRHHFGDGIVRHFLGPYNRKMWRVPLRRIDPAWAAWAVPVPTPAQIQEAARPGADLRLGYNTVFEYPRAGGIGVLAAALAQGDFRLQLAEKVVGVDLGRRRAETFSGRTFDFEHLVSTAPLPELVGMCRGLPPAVVTAAEKLRCVQICVANIGIARPATPALADKWARLQRRPNTNDPIEALSSRERQVLQLVANGQSNPLIAERLRISVRTVEVHRRNIMDKLGVKNGAGLIKFAVEHGVT